MAHAPRITARVSEEMQVLLKEAAALSGMKSINAFVLSAALEKARRIVADERRWQVEEVDAALFLEALERPAKEHEKLKKAHRAYLEAVEAP